MGLIGQLGLLAGLPLFKIFGDDACYGARTFVIDNWDVFLHWVYHFSAAFLVVDPFLLIVWGMILFPTFSKFFFQTTNSQAVASV